MPNPGPSTLGKLLGGSFGLKRSLPQVDGVVRLGGLQGAVEIIRDVDAVPHIRAKSKSDVRFGLGYVHAQDRLWQMEYQRRVGSGRLSELLGKRTVEIDVFLRTLGVYRAAVSAWSAMPTDARDSINDYVSGINAFLQAHSGPQFPPEFRLLRCSPAPWTGPDVIVWSKMMAYNLSSNFGSELLRSEIREKVGPAREAELMPGYPMDALSIVGSAGHDEEGLALLNLQDDVRSALGAGAHAGSGIGSNNWVVDGSKSASGYPVLAGDPHLGTGVPSTWYLAHMTADDLDVIGATVPGLPAVVLGRNKRISWAVTNFPADTQDLFEEHLDAEGASAEFQGAMEPLTIVEETIAVKGADPVKLKVRITRHGPLISDAINYGKKPIEPVRHLAMRWAALDELDMTVPSFMALNEARNWDDFRAALRPFVSPPQNFVYADVDGNIGYYAPGCVPVRASGDGTVPAEGWTGAKEWAGTIPFEELPHTFNPADHMIVTANNKPVGNDYPHFLGNDWQPRYRAERIEKCLEAKPKLTINDHMSIQSDTYSGLADALLPRLFVLVSTETIDECRAVEMLDEWDHDMRPESAPAAIFAAWVQRLPRALLENELGSKLTGKYEKWTSFTSGFLESELDRESQDVRAAVNAAFTGALSDLRKRLGRHMEHWRWGRLHKVSFPHQPFDRLPGLKGLLSRQSTIGGDASSVNSGPFAAKNGYKQTFATTYRQIIDMSSLDSGLFLQAIGQSGHFLSPHYDDYLADWQVGRYRPMRFSRELVDQSARARLRLMPI